MKNTLICLLAACLTASLIVQWRSAGRRAGPAVASPETEAGRFAAVSRSLAATRDDPRFAGAAIGLCVLDGAGGVALEHHARTAFIPASSLKTLTTATALEQLGADFRFETRVAASAEIADGVIKGDLLVIGGGDPVLSLSDLDRWAGQLFADGVRRVEGRVLGRGDCFAGSIFADFWNWGDIGNGYASPVAGLNLEHNRYVATLRPGDAIGSPAKLESIEPELPGVTVFNEVRTGEPDSGDRVVIYGGERTQRITLRGTVPAGDPAFPVVGAVPDPERFAAHHLREALVEAGVTIVGGALRFAECDDVGGNRNELLVHHSPPLIDIVKTIHMRSDNHETECLYQLLGTRAGKAPDTVIREHWAGRGLGFEGLRMVDGSGLARADFITPYELAMLQFLAGNGPAGVEYQNSLPSRGDGSLRWKGGAMSAIRSYAGFARGASGETYCFALMANHCADAGAVGELRETIWQALLEG